MSWIAEHRRGLGFGLIAIGAGLALSSLLGPLVTRLMVYPVSRTVVNQTIGLDAFSLVIVSPLSFIAGRLALRGHPAAPLLALGPALYTAYMMGQYVVGPDYLHYPVVLTLHLALFVLGWGLGLVAWNRIPSEYLRSEDPRRDRITGLVLLVLAGFVLVRYLPALVGSFTRAPLPAEARGDPAMYWVILLLDMGLIVPLAVAASLDLLAGGSPWARKAGYALVAWFALVSSSVACMGTVMVLREDRYASAGMTMVFALTAAAAIAASLWLYRPLLRPGPG
jgi:hypothetical protein